MADADLPYLRPAEYETAWRALVSDLGGRETVVGQSVEGRPLWRFEVGSRDPGALTILLTGLVHGVEVVGSAALFDLLARFRRPSPIEPTPVLRERARLVIMPVVNPDAFALNMERLGRGRAAWKRTNARGVDLNRNFPAVAEAPIFHPLAGSRFRLSPYYRGPHALSEPETRAVRDVADEVRPALALGFHSFGNLLLFPWAHSARLHPRFPRYRSLSDAFVGGLPFVRYRARQAFHFYPTIGDLDDWLDTAFGTLAFTVEVSQLDRRLLSPSRLLNPFWWMNPTRFEPTAENLSPGLLALLANALPAGAT